jgi:4-hydroxy-4-methyl-2-oxoglutarate aldolase
VSEREASVARAALGAGTTRDRRALPPTTALADVLQLRGLTGWLSPPLVPIAASPVAVCGPAVTVAVAAGPGPDGAGLKPLHEVLSEDLGGGVLVVAGADVVAGAVWGEILTLAAAASGAVAVLVEGRARDAGAVADVGIPLWALGLATAGPGGMAHVAAVGVPVDVGGVAVAPGRQIVVDADGVVCLPDRLERVLLDAGTAYAAAEDAVVGALRAGESLRAAYRHKRAVVAAITELGASD